MSVKNKSNKYIWIMNHYAGHMLEWKGGRHYWFCKILYNKGYEPVLFAASHTSANNPYDFEIEKGKYIFRDNDVHNYMVKTRPYKGNGLDRVMGMVDFMLNLFPAAHDCVKRYGKPKCIIASSVHPLTLVAGILLGKKYKVPCVCEIRDLWPEAIFAFGKARENSIIGKILIVGEHWIYKNADALIFTKEGDTDYLKEKGWTTEQGGNIELKKCFYINNGINLRDYLGQVQKETFKDEELEDDTFKIIYAGSIRPVNNVERILDCAKKLKSYKDIKFLIYGDGICFDKIAKRILNEKIDNVILKGFIEKKYIPYVLSKSSINLLNYSQTQYNWSRGNSSNKMFEYMASGKPIISTVKMGYSIIDKYRCGIELDNSSCDGLVSAILKIYNMSNLERESIGNNAREGSKDFDFHTLTDRLIKVIEYVSGRKK